MTLSQILRKLSLILLAGGLIFATPRGEMGRSLAQSQPPNWAGLVIVQPNQDPLTFCMDLDDGETTGIQLLEQAGVNFIADYGNSMGAAVCSIDGVGCAFPSQDCFCRCQGAECTYWSYHRLDPGAETWIYSQFGAGQTAVAPGSVEAWIWAEGQSGSSALQPPTVTFADICAGESTSAAPATDQLNWPTYAGFAVLLSILAAAGIWRRNRTSS